jgi:hypothetical protein
MHREQDYIRGKVRGKPAKSATIGTTAFFAVEKQASRAG